MAAYAANVLEADAAVSRIETQQLQPRSLLRFLTCGSVDDGKSTLIGRMLYECGAVFEDQLHALQRDSQKFGTDGDNLDFALLVDGLGAEREQGITIDVAYRYFATPRRAFIVADTPGHEQYTRNMATGASTADLAILLLDARKGVLPQTRRHAFINALLRVRHIVVAINKMDLVGFDENVFSSIARDFAAAAAGLDFASVTFVPVSARGGDNVTTPSHNMPWYRGPALLALLETIDTQSAHDDRGEFSMPVQWVNRPDQSFRGFSGTIASGRLKTGARIRALPAGRASHVTRIVTADGDLAQAQAGQAVTLVLADEIDISRADVIASADAETLQPRRMAQARLIWTSATPGFAGSRYVVKLAAAAAQTRIDTLHHLVGIEDFQPHPAETIAMNAIADVTLAFETPLVCADYETNRILGGFILIDRFNNETVAIGMISPGPAAALQQPERAAPGWRAQLVRRIERTTGVAGSHARGRFLAALAWRATAAAMLFAIAFAITASATTAAAIALLDLVLRTTLFSLRRRYWRATPKVEETNDAGAGI